LTIEGNPVAVSTALPAAVPSPKSIESAVKKWFRSAKGRLDQGDQRPDQNP